MTLSFSSLSFSTSPLQTRAGGVIVCAENFLIYKNQGHPDVQASLWLLLLPQVCCCSSCCSMLAAGGALLVALSAALPNQPQ